MRRRGEIKALGIVMDTVERGHALPSAVPASAADPYERLMSVTVRHDFYGDGQPCPDFVIAPSAPSVSLLRHLGLLARPRRDGIDILFRRSRCEGMVRDLWHRRHRRRTGPRSEIDLPASHNGSWSRVGLTFTLRNDLFANFTDIPLTALPSRNALHVSNRSCEGRAGDTVTLASDWSEHVADVPRGGNSPGNVEFATCINAKDFRLYDTSGRALLYAYPYNGDKGGKDKPAVNLNSPTMPPVVNLEAGHSVHARLNYESSGFYSTEMTTSDDPKERRERARYLFASRRNPPFLFLDLHFASPDPDDPSRGSYPVVLPDKLPNATESAASWNAPDCVTPRNYEISFKARKTTWVYYVVLPSDAAAAGGLAIETAGNGPQFGDSIPVTLPTGARASMFTAMTPWALRHRPDVRLRLRGSGAPGNGAKRIMLDRLPLPSAERIGNAASPTGIPSSGSAARIPAQPAVTSEVFVYV